MQSRLFSLEEENASLRRVAEIELPREIDSLKHQARRGMRPSLPLVSPKTPAHILLFLLWGPQCNNASIKQPYENVS